MRRIHFISVLSLCGLSALACQGAVSELPDDATSAAPGSVVVPVTASEPAAAAPATPGQPPRLPQPTLPVEAVVQTPPAPPNPAEGATSVLVETGLSRLTRPQYANSVLALTGVEVALDKLPADVSALGFSNVGASRVTTSAGGVSKYDDLASSIAAELFRSASATEFVGCEPQAADGACVHAFLTSRLSQAFRRPATADEVTRYAQLVDSVNVQLGAPAGLEYATAAMLQSPHFVHRVEATVPDASSPVGLRYDDFTLASRLSYLLTDGPPDDALVAAAAAAQLGAPGALAEQAARLLSAPTAELALMRYFEEWLGLSDLEGLTKNTDVFPAFNTEVSSAMRTELQLTFLDFAFGSESSPADYAELFTTRRTFLNELLADYYGTPLTGTERAVGDSGFFEVTFPEDTQRAGILGRGGLQAVNARETRTSPTLRGIFIREALLCQHIPSAPDDVDTEITPPPEGVVETQRMRLERHSTDPGCAGCHAFIDPLGLALENFDASGSFRTTEFDLPIDVTGDVDGVAFDGPRGLGETLFNHPRSTFCIAQKFAEHSVGRDLSPDSLRGIVAAFEGGGRSFPSLVDALVKSPAFRYPVQ